MTKADFIERKENFENGKFKNAELITQESIIKDLHKNEEELKLKKEEWRKKNLEIMKILRNIEIDKNKLYAYYGLSEINLLPIKNDNNKTKKMY